jgi:hypothetical protein
MTTKLFVCTMESRCRLPHVVHQAVISCFDQSGTRKNSIGAGGCAMRVVIRHRYSAASNVLVASFAADGVWRPTMGQTRDHGVRCECAGEQRSLKSGEIYLQTWPSPSSFPFPERPTTRPLLPSNESTRICRSSHQGLPAHCTQVTRRYSYRHAHAHRQNRRCRSLSCQNRARI